MADKLQIWKTALVHLGAAQIQTLTDNVSATATFEAAYPGIVEEAFSEGDWDFATTTAQLVETTSASVSYTTTYAHPADLHRIVAVSNDPKFRYPFTEYVNEGGAIHADTSPCYIRYIATTKIATEADWPPSFWRYVAAKLAHETCERVTQSTSSMEKLEKIKDKALKRARSVDARTKPVVKVSHGSWVRARQGGGIGIGGSSGVTQTLGGEITLTEGDV